MAGIAFDAWIDVNIRNHGKNRYLSQFVHQRNIFTSREFLVCLMNDRRGNATQLSKTIFECFLVCFFYERNTFANVKKKHK